MTVAVLAKCSRALYGDSSVQWVQDVEIQSPFPIPALRVSWVGRGCEGASERRKDTHALIISNFYLKRVFLVIVAWVVMKSGDDDQYWLL